MMIIKKTYARHRSIASRPDEPPAKRQRIGDREKPLKSTVSVEHDGTKRQQNRSSSSVILRSDLPSEAAPTPSTPSSSPPSETSGESNEDQKPLYAPTPHPLQESNANPQTRKKPPDKPKFKKFTQLTLDLGQPTEKHCTECGMTYRPSNTEDRQMHKKHHARHRVEMGLSRTFVQSLSQKNVIWRDEVGNIVTRVTREDQSTKRTHVETVLDAVEQELGGVGIPSSILWCNIRQRYAVFLYIRGDDCLGVCVAQKITSARRVLPFTENVQANAADENADKSIIASKDDYPATLGISRIWTSKQARRKGIAKMLLDMAISNFEFAVSIPKEMVAFSQPTDSGTRLARSWFGREDGWLVYAE